MDSYSRQLVTTFTSGSPVRRDDFVAVEEPLEIRLRYTASNAIIEKPLSVTMRTPGQDSDLATGFLFTEGIIKSAAEILRVHSGLPVPENQVVVELKPGVVPSLGSAERNFYTTSSCGVCGKSSIDAVRVNCKPISSSLQLGTACIQSLPGKLREAQSAFERTGGLHASGLFDAEGRLLLVREDVGRHNALDKLIGAGLMNEELDFNSCVLCLSGRISFELVQKAAVAGMAVIVAIGAPSSLAIRLASEVGISLCGFVRDDRFNVYAGDAVAF